jgi:hypothetical protein
MLGSTFANDLLKLIFQATAIANVADNAASGPLTNLYVSLHTGPVNAGASQTTNETSYTGYARVAVARSGSGFTVTAAQLVNAAQVLFAACTAGSATLTHWAIGTASSGTGKVLVSGALGTALGPFVGESTNDTITNKGHGLSVSDRVVFYAPAGATLPTGISEGVVYFVKTVTDSDNVTLSVTDGGATLDLTADGDGIMWKISPLAVGVGVQPSISAGALVYDLLHP